MLVQPPRPLAFPTTPSLAGEVAAVPVAVSVPAAPRALREPAAGIAEAPRAASGEARVEPAGAIPSSMPPMDEPAVRAVLQQYGAAYTRLDARAARAVWPSVDVRALARAFDELESQEVVLGRCEVSVQGREARAACTGSARYVPRMGDRTPRVEPRHWTFQLEKTRDDGWRIASALISAR